VRREERATFTRGWNGRMLTLTPTAADLRRELLAEEAPALGAIAVVSLLTQVFGIGGPLASAWIIDRVLVDGDVSLLKLLLLGMLVLLTFHVLAGGLREYLVAHASARLTLGIQLRFFDHVLRLPPATAASIRVGDLAVRIREADALVRHAFQAGFHLVVDSISLVAHVGLLALISPPLAAIAVAAGLVQAGVSLLASSRSRRIADRRLETQGAVRSQIVEAVAGIHTIKALVLEPLFLARGRKALARQRADQFAEARIAADLDVAGRALQAASVVAMLAIGSVLTLQGDSTAGRMVAAVGIFGAAMVPLNGLLR
jgi:ATP-binding cassette subfamily B protein RaxB